MFTSGLAKEPTKMAKTSKTPLEKKIDEVLPRSISLQDLKPTLDLAGITMRTFERDRKNQKPQTIPLDRLKVYAQMLGCEVDDLIVTYTKVKSILKSSLAKKVGIIVTLLIVSFSCQAQRGMMKVPNMDTVFAKLFDKADSAFSATHLSSSSSRNLSLADTLKVIMLVTDTSKLTVISSANKPTPFYGDRTFHAKGYTVLNGGYLDERKQPVPENWIVWISYLVKSF